MASRFLHKAAYRFAEPALPFRKRTTNTKEVQADRTVEDVTKAELDTKLRELAYSVLK